MYITFQRKKNKLFKKKLKIPKKEDQNLRRAVPKDAYLITDEKDMKL